MTLRDALGHAIDAMRSHDSEADTTLRQAAKVLEDKLSRMRAREEPKLGFLYRCDCGDRRREKMLVCDECYRIIPGKFFIDLHIGTKGEKRKARRAIRVICESRISADQEVEAA